MLIASGGSKCLDENMEKYKHLLCIFQALGMPQEAIVCYQRALQVRPDYAMAFGERLFSVMPLIQCIMQ